MIITAVLSGCSRNSAGNGAAIIDSARNNYIIGNYIESIRLIDSYLKNSADGHIKSDSATDAEAYKLLGNIHLIYNDLIHASEYYRKAIEFADRLPDKKEKLKLTYNLVLLHKQLEQQSQVEKYIREIRDMKDANPDLRQYFYYCALGIRDYAFTKNGDTRKWMYKALQLIDERNLEPYLKFNPYQYICNDLIDKQEYEEVLTVLHQYERAIKAAKESPESELECAQTMANMYNQIGDTIQAGVYTRRVQALSDSLSDQQQFLTARQQLEETETGEFRRNGSPLPQWILIMITSTLSALATSLIIFWFRRRKSHHAPVPDDTAPADTASHEDIPRETDSAVHTTSSLAPVTSVTVPAVSHVTAHAAKQAADNEATSADNSRYELFLKIDALMHQESVISNTSLSLETLSRMLDTNVKYVSQAVSKGSGMNFRAYVNSIRIKEVCRRFDRCDDRISIKEISRKTGFASQSVFIAAFRLHTGMTPSQYRERNQKTENATNLI